MTISMLSMPLWAWWVTAAVLLVLLDLSLLGAQFILIPTALAALLAALVDLAGGGLSTQIWTFAIGTAVLTPALIYLFRRYLVRDSKAPGPLESGWERGQEAVIVRQGDRLVARLKGDTYPFRSLEGREPAEGETWIVERMQGITLVLRSRES